MSAVTTNRSPVRFIDSWSSIHFDLLRGLAALVVFFEHGRNIFFLDFPMLGAHRWLLAVPYILVGAGHQAVVLFFVLSGYFIGGTVFRSLERGQWNWKEYLLRRLVRLWIVLIPALILCFFWDRLGIYLGHAPALYAGHVRNNIIFESIAPKLVPHVFWGNFFFLQTILVPVFGSDSSLWSLANEFWYYILFPLGLIAFRRTTGIVPRLICAALFFIVAGFVGIKILQLFPLWLAGVVLFRLPAPSFSQRKGRFIRIGASLIYAVIFFGLGRRPLIDSLTSDYLLTIVTFIFLYILLSDREPHPVGARRVRISRELARFSYTLYAAHLPIIVFLGALVVGEGRWEPTTVHILYGAFFLFAILLYCWALAFITEFRTDAFRRRIERLFGMRDIPSRLPSNPLTELVPAGHGMPEENQDTVQNRTY